MEEDGRDWISMFHFPKDQQLVFLKMQKHIKIWLENHVQSYLKVKE